MPIRGELREVLTPRERAEMDWEKQSAEMQMHYAEQQAQYELDARKLEAEGVLLAKKAEIDLSRLKAEHALAIKQLEVKWLGLLRLPLNIVLLPVKLIMALAVPISAFTHRELPKEFWEFIK